MPKERFDVFLQRLAEMAKARPALLEQAIKGVDAAGVQATGRSYLFGFLLVLDPYIGRLQQ